MGNRGKDKSELFLLIPKAKNKATKTANKRYTPYTYQRFFIMLKVFKMIIQSLFLPSHPER